MPHFLDPLIIQDHHIIVIPRGHATWLSAGPGFMAPLCFIRDLALKEEERALVWTVWKEGASTEGWEIQPNQSSGLVFPITLSTHPIGWKFVINKEIRDNGFLPGAGEKIIREIDTDKNEINIWRPDARNIYVWRTATK